MDSNISYQKVTDCKEWSVLRITPVQQDKSDEEEVPRPKTPNLRRERKHNKIKIVQKKSTVLSNEEVHEFLNK